MEYWSNNKTAINSKDELNKNSLIPLIVEAEDWRRYITIELDIKNKMELAEIVWCDPNYFSNFLLLPERLWVKKVILSITEKQKIKWLCDKIREHLLKCIKQIEENTD